MEIDGARPAALDKDKNTESAVAGDENSALRLGDLKQYGVVRFGQTQLSGGCNVMVQATQ